jgi:hypothetical protein
MSMMLSRFIETVGYILRMPRFATIFASMGARAPVARSNGPEKTKFLERPAGPFSHRAERILSDMHG